MKKIIIPCVFAFVAVITVIIVLLINCTDKYRLIKINSFEGEVVVGRNEEDADAFEGMKLIPRDSVEVKNNSFLELLCDSDKHICAEENTGFSIFSGGNEKDGYITIALNFGKALFTIDNKLPENSFFDVITPNVTLSVRGTEFSVGYNPETGETNVEVFEGKVWAVYNGIEEILEKGDIRAIRALLPPPLSPENSDSTETSENNNPSPDENEAENTYYVGFIVESVFSNTPDYATAIPIFITMTYPEGEGVGYSGEYTNPPLEDCKQEIIEKYLRNLMPNLIEQFEDVKQNLIKYGRDGIENSPVGIGKWLEDFEIQQIVIPDRMGNYYKFKPEDLYFEWVITQSEADAQGNYRKYYPMGYEGEFGAPYRISGVKYHFYGTAEKYE